MNPKPAAPPSDVEAWDWTYAPGERQPEVKRVRIPTFSQPEAPPETRANTQPGTCGDPATRRPPSG